MAASYTQENSIIKPIKHILHSIIDVGFPSVYTHIHIYTQVDVLMTSLFNKEQYQSIIAESSEGKYPKEGYTFHVIVQNTCT